MTVKAECLTDGRAEVYPPSVFGCTPNILLFIPPWCALRGTAVGRTS